MKSLISEQYPKDRGKQCSHHVQNTERCQLVFDPMSSSSAFTAFQQRDVPPAMNHTNPLRLHLIDMRHDPHAGPRHC